MKLFTALISIALLISGCGNNLSQQGDPDFVPVVIAPAFQPGGGPRIALDEAHWNFHTLSGRFQAFASLARADGYEVEALTTSFDQESLSGFDLLVVANALNERNYNNWELPTPSAFSPDEITAVREWIEAGGAILLIADHMPFPGAASDMAAAFGFELNNGYAVKPRDQSTLVFRRSDGSLVTHPVTQGRSEDEAVLSVATFTGSAFHSPPGATDLFIMPNGFISVMPEAAGQIGPDSPRIDVAGWSQGSVMQFGDGRVAMFGEAAMFTAQRVGADGPLMGMNAPIAGENQQFVTNLIRWLTRVD